MKLIKPVTIRKSIAALLRGAMAVAAAAALLAAPPGIGALSAPDLDSEPGEIRVDADSAELDEGAFLDAQDAIAGAVPEITAPSAILIERGTGTVIYEKDADARREPASVTKIMTMLLVVEALEAGAIGIDDAVTVSPRAASMGGTQIYLREGEKMSVRDMLKGVAVNSANDAAVALAEHISGSEDAFVAEMNARATGLGMINTYFTNCSGLIKSAEHRTTARDVAAMSRELLGHSAIREYTQIWTDSLRDGGTALTNTNRLVRFYDGTTGLKTGYTSTAGYCLSASAARDGVEYIAVTLGDKTSNDRFESARALLSYAFATYTLVPAGPDAALAPIRVNLGKTPFIQPEIKGYASLLVTRAEARELTRALTIPEKLTAPVRTGDVIGIVTVKAGERTLAETQIIAGQNSERLGWGDIFFKLIQMLFESPENRAA